MNSWIDNIELTGSSVSLIPLKKSHRQDLLDAASDGNLWELWFTSVPSIDTIDDYISIALLEKEKARSMPYVVLERKNNKIIGSTRYCNMEPVHRRLEIGYTWYSKRYQRTSVNTECKLLLLHKAFEVFNCGCVQFKTHSQNLSSRKAIHRLGAKQDGILRNDRIIKDGTYRDTVVFSIIESEWPSVEDTLNGFLSKYN